MIYQVSKEKYDVAIKLFKGIIAHRSEDGKYFIKLFYPGYSKQIKDFVNS